MNGALASLRKYYLGATKLIIQVPKANNASRARTKMW